MNTVLGILGAIAALIALVVIVKAVRRHNAAKRLEAKRRDDVAGLRPSSHAGWPKAAVPTAAHRASPATETGRSDTSRTNDDGTTTLLVTAAILASNNGASGGEAHRDPAPAVSQPYSPPADTTSSFSDSGGSFSGGE